MAKRISLAAAKKKAAKLLKGKRAQEAKKRHIELIKAAPLDHELWLGLGLAEVQLGCLGEAEAALRRTLELRPDELAAYAALAQLLVAQGRNHEAETVCQLQVKFAPDDYQALYHLGLVLNRQRKFAEAHDVLSKVLLLDDDLDADFYVQYGQALLNQGLFAKAHEQLTKALQLQPDNINAYTQLAALYTEQQAFKQAQQCYEKLYSLQPDNKADYLCNRASLCERQGDHQQALATLDVAVDEFPRAADVRWLRAASLLLLGRMAEGWAEYEARLTHPAWLAAMDRCEFARPRWDGSDLNGKTILVYSEQGFGDAIQFSRYFRLLHEQGARIIFYCDKELVSLFSGLDIIHRVEPKSYQKAQSENFDFHVALMSLPYFFKTTLDTIPAPLAGLNVSEQKIDHWRNQLAEKKGLKVGLVWAGRPTHTSDRRRSCHIEQMGELLAVPGVQFVSLQKGPALEQLSLLNNADVIELGSQLHDFADTAALIKNLDLLISVDTAVAHLAATMDCPVWTLVYHPPEWRWLLERDDSPWYPAMTLFRQAPSESWPAVFERVASQLRSLLASAGE